jgi:hypothetical protein
MVDLTDPQAKKVFEIGTATPSTSEILRKEGQRDVWEQIGADAEDLVDSGYDGKIWGRLPDGRFVDLTGAEYLEIPLP